MALRRAVWRYTGSSVLRLGLPVLLCLVGVIPVNIFSYLYEICIKLAKHPKAPWFLSINSFIESIFWPIPPDVMLMPMCLATPKRSLYYAGITTVTSVLGAICGYYLGYFIYDPYIADLIAEMFRKSGTESALINLGGNVYGLGTKSDGEPWKVGLQDPFSEHGGYFTTVSCSDASVVTSGGYERHFIAEDGRIYHHLLDWKTGYPASSDIISSTIISSDSTLSDMLSTACFVLGSERAEAVVDHYGVSALFLLEDGSIERIRI